MVLTLRGGSREHGFDVGGVRVLGIALGLDPQIVHHAEKLSRATTAVISNAN